METINNIPTEPKSKLKLFIGIAVGLVVVVAIGLTMKGNMFKGSFDVADASDVKIANFTVPTGDFKTTKIQNLTYSLSKDASNLFISVKNKAGKFYMFPIQNTDLTSGAHSISIDADQFPSGFFAKENAPYTIQMIAYNVANEISDIQPPPPKTVSITYDVAVAPVATPPSESKITLKADANLNKPLPLTKFENPLAGITLKIEELKQNGLSFKAVDPNKESFLYESVGNNFMQYNWQFVKNADNEDGQSMMIWKNSDKFGMYAEKSFENPGNCIKSVKTTQDPLSYKVSVCPNGTIPKGAFSLGMIKSGSYTLSGSVGDGKYFSGFISTTFMIDDGINAIPKGIMSLKKTDNAPLKDKLTIKKPESGQSFKLSDLQKNGLIFEAEDLNNESYLKNANASNGYYLAHRWRLYGMDGKTVVWQNWADKDSKQIFFTVSNCKQDVKMESEASYYNIWACANGLIQHGVFENLNRVPGGGYSSPITGNYKLEGEVGDGKKWSDPISVTFAINDDVTPANGIALKKDASPPKDIVFTEPVDAKEYDIDELKKTGLYFSADDKGDKTSYAYDATKNNEYYLSYQWKLLRQGNTIWDSNQVTMVDTTGKCIKDLMLPSKVVSKSWTCRSGTIPASIFDTLELKYNSGDEVNNGLEYSIMGIVNNGLSSSKESYVEVKIKVGSMQRDYKRKEVDMNNIANAIHAYRKANNNKPPPSEAGNTIPKAIEQYIKPSIPVDPSDGSSYYYRFLGDGLEFCGPSNYWTCYVIGGKMENKAEGNSADDFGKSTGLYKSYEDIKDNTGKGKGLWYYKLQGIDPGY